MVLAKHLICDVPHSLHKNQGHSLKVEDEMTLSGCESQAWLALYQQQRELSSSWQTGLSLAPGLLLPGGVHLFMKHIANLSVLLW